METVEWHRLKSLNRKTTRRVGKLTFASISTKITKGGLNSTNLDHFNIKNVRKLELLNYLLKNNIPG